MFVPVPVTVGGMFSGSSKVPVKFSLDADLSDSDCHKLLSRYTPQHMKRNKTSQKLFIRCVCMCVCAHVCLCACMCVCADV